MNADRRVFGCVPTPKPGHEGRLLALVLEIVE